MCHIAGIKQNIKDNNGQPMQKKIRPGTEHIYNIYFLLNCLLLCNRMFDSKPFFNVVPMFFQTLFLFPIYAAIR